MKAATVAATAAGLTGLALFWLAVLKPWPPGLFLGGVLMLAASVLLRPPRDRPPPPKPEFLAWQLMFLGGSPRTTHAGVVLTDHGAAPLTAPAAVRYVFDYDADGYLIRGSMDRDPGPFPHPTPPADRPRPVQTGPGDPG